MFKQWGDTVHNQNVFPLRESNSIMYIVSQPSKCLEFCTFREGCFIISN